MAHYRGLAGARQITALLIAILLSACAAPPKPSTQPLPPAPPLPVEGATLYRIVPEASALRIRVYSAGPLGNLGHNHVIVTTRMRGVLYMHPRITDSGFKVQIPLQGLRVDPPAARRDAGQGFASTVDDQARAGTRKNMLGPEVLAADRYPVMTLRSIKVEGPKWRPRITVRITLHGVSHDYVVPTAIVRLDDRLIAIGGLELQQTDFGITPFSVLGGALQVANTVKVSFRFVAVETNKRTEQHH